MLTPSERLLPSCWVGFALCNQGLEALVVSAQTAPGLSPVLGRLSGILIKEKA
jgi:hypothetical protein